MPLQNKVPFIDFKRQYGMLGKEIHKAIERVFSSGNFILAEEIRSFEQEFAGYCGCSSAAAVASGTEALYISLLACDVKPGDEVITVANANVPPVAAIMMAGAVPVFVDIEPLSYTMDPSIIEDGITEKTRALIPVHLYGQCADMKPILEIAREKGIRVIEDACQAHGALYSDRKAGSLGDLGCFSFYPTKNLGAYGDAGIIVSSDDELAKKARMLRNYGQIKKYKCNLKGVNSRMDEIQAAILRVKLKHLDKWNKKRVEIATLYDKHIRNVEIIKPHIMDYGTHVFHLYVIACRERDKLMGHMAEHGIETLVHYPLPVYSQEAYAEFRESSNCPVTEKYSRMVLSLPIYPEIREDEVHYVCEVLNGFRG